MSFRKSLISIVTVGTALGCVLCPSLTSAAVSTPLNYPYPRTANVYITWAITENDVRELAKWDVVIIDMEAQINSPQQLKELKQYNPNIILLAYFPTEEVRYDAMNRYNGVLDKAFAAGLDSSWYVNKNGQHYGFWPGAYEINVSDIGPTVNGQQYSDYVSHFVATQVLSSGLWDGIFFDNVWDGVTWATGPTLDLTGDGIPDQDINKHWNNGLQTIIDKTRTITNNKYLIVGNAHTTIYHNNLNGILLEDFPFEEAWPSIMNEYAVNETGTAQPRVSIINSNTGNTGNQADYQRMRFGLASTLMDSGFFSFDFGNQKHEQLWWYDEYDQKLGGPVGPPVSLNGKKPYQLDVWRRDFVNGVALVNPTSKAQTIDLGGDYEKITGTQVPSVNDGSIVEQVTVAAQDGLLVFKTFQSINNVLAANGSFLRFYALDGSRARNGFFTSDKAYTGGTRVMNVDLDGDGANEKIVVTDDQRLQILNSSGGQWISTYPYGPNAPGTLTFAVGNVFPGTTQEIVAASSKSPVLTIYNYHGAVINDQAYPFGKKYTGGLTAAVVKTEVGKPAATVVATTKGVPTQIGIFNQYFTKPSVQFYPFGKTYTGGVTITTGDFKGDGNVEIAAMGIINKKQTIRTFSLTGKQLSQFTVQSLYGGTDPLPIGTANINQSVKDEIVVISPN